MLLSLVEDDVPVCLSMNSCDSFYYSLGVARLTDDETFEALVDNGKSDSANLDAVVELLVQSSKSPTEALMLMVPEAFGSQPALNNRPEVRSIFAWW